MFALSICGLIKNGSILTYTLIPYQYVNGDTMQSTPKGLANTFLIMACVVIVLAGMKSASVILIPFLLSVFVALACYPLIELGNHYRIPKGISVLIVIVMVVLIGFMLAGLVGKSMNEFSQSMPVYEEKLRQQFSTVTALLKEYDIPIDARQLNEYFDPGMAMNLASQLLSGLGGVMANVFLIVLTVVFMLLEGPSLSQKIHIALDDPEQRQQQIDRFLKSVKDYLAIKTLVSLGTGLVIGITLYLMGVNHFLLWGVLAFLLNYIPNIGSIIAAVPAVILALIQLGPLAALGTAAVYLTTNTVMGNVIEPRFMGRGLGLSTLVVFLSLIFWGWLLGTVGMLLSVPLTMIVKLAAESNPSSVWLAQLLSGDEGNTSELTQNTENEVSTAVTKGQCDAEASQDIQETVSVAAQKQD